MNARESLRRPALFGALALGVLAKALLDPPGRLGLNVALWALAGVAVLVALRRRGPVPPSREWHALVGAALVFTALPAWRHAGALTAFALLAALGLATLAAGRAGAPWGGRAYASEVAAAALRTALRVAAGPFGWGRAPRSAADADWRGRARTLARGTALALPALLLLTALLTAADPVFAALVGEAVRFDVSPYVDDAAMIAFFAWVAAGYLRASLVPDGLVVDRLPVPEPRLPPAEVSVALWTLNLLFAAFVAVQLRYLFGGADLVGVTPGLGYAEYARRGFFELLAVAALVVPILLVADWAAARDDARARARLRATMLLLVVLLGGVLVSAAWRMRLYFGAYGPTELRLYASTVLAWLAFALVWLVATVLRGRRERFVPGAIAALLACVPALHLANPQAIVARAQLDRAAAGGTWDPRYLGRLGADAVPTIVDGLGRLPAEERCDLAFVLRERWAVERPGGWRSFSVADWRARRTVRALPVDAGCS